MNNQDLKKYSLPDQPGIYRFWRGKNILYIGKATSLRDRVRSYFAGGLENTRGLRLVKMLVEADRLSWETTDSVLEALILESILIKKFQPKYNAREKDNKSYYYVVITKEKWPRVLTVRGRELFSFKNFNLKADNSVFGPFPSGRDLKIALNLIRKIFPYRDNCTPLELTKKTTSIAKPCFNRQLGLCPGVCTGEITVIEYRQIISRLKMFFSGRVKKLRQQMENKMLFYARKQAFEQANEIKKSLFALNHIQDVALIKNDYHSVGSTSLKFEAFDISHLAGADTVGSMVVWQNGVLATDSYRRFNLKFNSAGQIDDLKNLAEILSRRFDHPDWPFPDVIVVDGDERARQTAIKIITQKKLSIEVVAVTKNRQHRASKILGDSRLINNYRQIIITVNAEAHRFAISFHRQKRQRSFGV